MVREIPMTTIEFFKLITLLHGVTVDFKIMSPKGITRIYVIVLFKTVFLTLLKPNLFIKATKKSLRFDSSTSFLRNQVKRRNAWFSKNFTKGLRLKKSANFGSKCHQKKCTEIDALYWILGRQIYGWFSARIYSGLFLVTPTVVYLMQCQKYVT